ncbi:MAG TPA: hypothetical protein VHE55_14145 [Fimbriimonadaceae bacterium]|nr:hypothetical protein [Fimbriimonadaceae bacterium]
MLYLPAMPSSAVKGFPSEIESTFVELSQQCASIVEAVCGSGARAKDVSDRFGVHAKLGWQIWNVANAPSLGALRYLPTPPGLKSWRQAAEARSVPASLLSRFDAAVADVERVIERHADDREMFEMLLDAEEHDADAELRWRKQAFLGNSFTFGARARCTVAAAILFPAPGSPAIGMVRLNGLVDLVRTRAGIRWPFSSLVVEQSGDSRIPGREPLVPSKHVAPLIPEFCSEPIPEIERRQEGDVAFDELLPTSVGLTGAGTIFTGEIIRELGSPYGQKPGEVAYFGTGIRTPSEVLVCDHIVHRSLFPGVQRELRVYSELASPTARSEADRIEVHERLNDLGFGLHRVRTADVPQYAGLLETAFEKANLDPEEFHVFRVVMRYPPIPASVMIRHPLLDPPQ